MTTWLRSNVIANSDTAENIMLNYGITGSRTYLNTQISLVGYKLLDHSSPSSVRVSCTPGVVWRLLHAVGEVQDFLG